MGTFLQFTRANDAAAATTKKLVKQAVLAEHFRSLDDADLPLAVRYAAGRPFPATDERTLNVGGAIFSDVAMEKLRMDAGAFHALAVRSGEIGEAMAAGWSRSGDLSARSHGTPGEGAGEEEIGRTDARGAGNHPHPLPGYRERGAEPLALREMATRFDQLAATGNVERKKQLLRELLDRCVAPREAAYVAKIIFGDLRTGVQEGVLEAAVAAAFERPLAEVRRAQLLVGDLGAVALRAKQNTLGEARFELFHPIQFMLATPQETAAEAAETFDGRTFDAEDKLDGIRAQIHKSGEADAVRIAIYTRTMDRTDASFPDVVEAVRALPGDFLLDGEIVPYRDGVVLPFANIQKRLGRKILTAKILKDHPAVFIAFDILYRNGELLMDQPLRERRTALVDLAGVKLNASHSPGVDAVPARAALLISAPTPVGTAEQIEAAFERSRQSRNEGLVLKDPESAYSPGRRGKMWLKLKTHLPTLDCVVTAAEFGHGKRRNSLSDYTFAVWDREPDEPGAALVNVGKAYSGVTDEEIVQLTELFLGISLGNNGRVHAVPPRVVLEIAADQIQRSARHASGYALRFPRIKRIRWDKKPEDADRLSRVAEVYASGHNFGQNDAASAKQEAPEPTLFD